MDARRTKLIGAGPEALWAVVGDPHHFPRWWPGVRRMEGVGDERFTQVYTTKKGRAVRIDFRVVASEPPDGHSPGHRAWAQEIAGTPFERVLREAVTEVILVPAGPAGTEVTIALRQKLRGYSRTGGWLLRRTTKARLDEALEGLERIAG
jgi:carbon monoxide dehydrogenase subunit G